MKPVREMTHRLVRRLPSSVPSQWTRPLGRAAVLIVVLYAALLMAPFSYEAPGSGLDASHEFASNYFPNTSFLYGRDLVFSYGPLGFVAHPMDIGANLTVANIIRFAIWLVLFGYLTRLALARGGGTWRAFVTAISLVAVSGPLLYSFDYFMLAAMIVIVSTQPLLKHLYWPAVLLGALSGTLALYKFSTYALSLVVLVLFSYVQGGAAWRQRNWTDLTLTGLAFLGGPIAYAIYNPSWSDLVGYFRASSELANGYSEAMGLPANVRDTVLAGILIAALLGQLAFALWRRSLGRGAALIFLPLTFLAFKHGYVRADNHVVFFYGMSVLLSTAALCIMQAGPREYAATALLWFATLSLGYAGLVTVVPAWKIRSQSIQPARERWSALLDWQQTTAVLRERTKQNRSWDQLPAEIKSLMAGSIVTVFPWELSYAATGAFQLAPLFTLQSYSAYTRYLDEQTAAKLAARAGSVDYVLLDWDAIDGRHPLLDVPRTANVLRSAYEPELLSGNHLLLKRRKTWRQPQLKPLVSTGFRVGNWINVPDSKRPVWASAEIPHSLGGWLKTVLLRGTNLKIEMEFTGGVHSSYRVIRSTLESPFEITGYSPDIEAYFSLSKNGIAQYPVRRLRFIDASDGRDFYTCQIRFWEQLDAVLTIDAPSDTAVSFESEFHLISPANIGQVMGGGVDTIAGQRLPNPLPSHTNPMVVGGSRGLAVEGWVATDGARGRAFDKVYGVIGTNVVEARRRPRPDVAAYFKNPAVEYSGYALSIPPASLPKGLTPLYLVGVVNDGHSLYRTVQPLWVDIR